MTVFIKQANTRTTNKPIRAPVGSTLALRANPKQDSLRSAGIGQVSRLFLIPQNCHVSRHHDNDS